MTNKPKKWVLEFKTVSNCKAFVLGLRVGRILGFKFITIKLKDKDKE